MDNKLTLTNRQIKEIQHAMFYTQYCNHGTTGHNQLVLIHDMARALGFSMPRLGEIEIPLDRVEVFEEIRDKNS